MQHRQNLAKLEQNWALERHQFQQDILNLQNSTDAKIIEQLEETIKKKQNLLDDTIDLLGKEDIHNLNDLEIHFLADVARDSNLNPYKLFKKVITKKLDNNVLATIHDEKSVFYRIINPEEIQHEKTLGGGMEKFAYHVEVVGGMIPFTNSWALVKATI